MSFFGSTVVIWKNTRQCCILCSNIFDSIQKRKWYNVKLIRTIDCLSHRYTFKTEDAELEFISTSLLTVGQFWFYLLLTKLFSFFFCCLFRFEFHFSCLLYLTNCSFFFMKNDTSHEWEKSKSNTVCTLEWKICDQNEMWKKN